MATIDLLKDFHEYGANLNSREIFLHNYYSAEDNYNPGVEYRMSNNFIKNLRALDLKSDLNITIHSHSIGGEWCDGMAIYDAIQMCRSYITLIVYGQAESMSSIFMQAADYRYMAPNAHFMCHYGSSDINTDYLSAMQQAKYEEKICDIMFDVYAKRCINGQFFIEKFGKNVTEKQVKQYLIKKFKDGDWYLNAEEAVYYGFADSILEHWHLNDK